MTAPSVTTPAPPPADHRLSPLTGHTRAHWEAAADHLLDALQPYATPGLAQYRLPGRTGYSGEQSDGVEGYARSFLLAAFRIAGASRPGEREKLAPLIERYAAGLTAGTDPRHPEHWPAINDRSQTMVEAASVAIALHETRPWLWDRLDDRVRGRVVDWLTDFVGATANDSNWRLFQVVVEEFLASVDAPHSRAEIDAGLARLDDWYRGGGWYTDGDGQKFDYYNAWALHLYPVLWARIAGERADPALTATHRRRLHTFLDTHQYFFGADGAPLHQGRSLTYRYATTAALWAGALTDATPLPPGRTRRLASGALKHFTDHGVPGPDGLLSLGWYHPYLPVTQPYSGPASPYWAAKAFLGLLLPDTHPVWKATEEPGPVETRDTVLALPGPGWLLHSTAADGIVRLVNHGSDRQAPAPATPSPSPHYSRLAYSTATAPQTPPDDHATTVDHHIAVLDAAAESRRQRIHRLATADGALAASWYTDDGTAPGAAATIATISAVHRAWEIRVHLVHAEAGATVRETGWSLAYDDTPCTVEAGPGWVVARRADGLTSALAGRLGWDGPAVLRDGIVVQATGLNAYGQHSATPALVLPHHPGGTLLLATLVVLTRDPQLTDDTHLLCHGARVRTSADGGMDLRFPDGHRVRVDPELMTAARERVESGEPRCRL
ncbi:DUF2264 domain-containing protein [Streptomyces justiciae]|uniref:DUF2264 domain-containing protein n=1 Tax=Streptomyces justiciae TaxID=2780140 RepID=UPI0021180EBD|nr:DUF2264 domain-containing protein [Streptomyces justiciae]MCW8375827.1 DUF2264 domain-containing protein [Streptomyces justiciae]